MLSLCHRGLTYCRQIGLRMTQALTSSNQSKIALNIDEIKTEQTRHLSTTLRLHDASSHRYKFTTPSPYKNPGARRHGYRQTIFDGGPLPRGETQLKTKSYHPKDSWSKKRACFGQNDYIDILGDGNIHPVDLINAPAWLIGFRGNELQRLLRRLAVEGHKIQQLYPLHYHHMRKRVRYLYKKYNHKRER